jgi:hypothetical protein
MIIVYLVTDIIYINFKIRITGTVVRNTSKNATDAANTTDLANTSNASNTADVANTFNASNIASNNASNELHTNATDGQTMVSTNQTQVTN